MDTTSGSQQTPRKGSQSLAILDSFRFTKCMDEHLRTRLCFCYGPGSRARLRRRGIAFSRIRESKDTSVVGCLGTPPHLNFQAFDPWVCPHPKAGPGNDRSFDMWRRTSHGLMSPVCRSLRPPPFRGFKGKPNGRRPNCGVPSEKTCPSSRARRVISDLILPDRAAMLLPAK